MATRPNSTTSKIKAYVADHPGFTGSEINEVFKVTNAHAMLGQLLTRGEITSKFVSNPSKLPNCQPVVRAYYPIGETQ